LGSFKSLNENKADFKVIGGGDRILAYLNSYQSSPLNLQFWWRG